MCSYYSTDIIIYEVAKLEDLCTDTTQQLSIFFLSTEMLQDLCTDTTQQLSIFFCQEKCFKTPHYL